ncbi:MAG: EamA family transporter [Candidatus Methylomirabilales bacterium]
MSPWLPPALFALVIWAVQRVVSKAALSRLTTRKFYLLNAAISFVVYLPYVLYNPPAAARLPGALGLSVLMAATFWVTTEALRRGPLGRVSPLTSLSPALTAILAVAILGESLAGRHLAGLAAATPAVALLSFRSDGRSEGGEQRAGWLPLTLASLAMQGVGAFLAKLVVTPAGPSLLLLSSSGLQLLIGLSLAPGAGWTTADLRGGLIRATAAVMCLAGIATIGYLYALSVGPASLIVPLVATSPALAGVMGIVVLREGASRTQLAGMALGLLGAVLLAS